MDQLAYATSISNVAGNAKAVVEQVVDRNPDLPPVVRRRLMTAVFRLEALASVEQLMRLAAATGPEPDGTSAGGPADGEPSGQRKMTARTANVPTALREPM